MCLFHIIIIIYFLSLCTHCICAKCWGRTLKVYVKDKCFVKYQTAHFEAYDWRERVDIYGRSDYQLWNMYTGCCGCILMSASAFFIHMGMSACFALPFVHQSVASARLSVRLMIVYHCSHRFIFCPSIWLVFRLSIHPSVCLSVCMFTWIYVETTLYNYWLQWSRHKDLSTRKSDNSPRPLGRGEYHF